MVFNVIAVKEGKKREKERQKEREGGEGATRGSPARRQGGPARVGMHLPHPHGGARRPRNFPPAPAATFPSPGSFPSPLQDAARGPAAPGKGDAVENARRSPALPPRRPARPRPPAYLGSQAGDGQQTAEQRESFPDLQERERERGWGGR